MKKPLLVFYSFVLLNFAAVAGLYHFVRGENPWRDIWTKPFSTRAGTLRPLVWR